MHTEFVLDGTRQMTVSFGRNDNARTQLTLSTDAHSLQSHSGPAAICLFHFQDYRIHLHVYCTLK